MAFDQTLTGDQFVVSIIQNDKPLREYNENNTRVCHVPFESEYKVRIKNKSFKRAMATISIDGTDAMGSRKLILEPHQTIDVERFVENLGEGKKFKFVSLARGVLTGEIQDPTSSENGAIKVDIYPELVLQTYFSGYFGNSSLRGNSLSGSSWSVSNGYGSITCQSSPEPVERSLAGATAEGSVSTQQFSEGQSFATVVTPLSFKILLRGSYVEDKMQVTAFKSVKDDKWCSSIPFVIKIKNGNIWVENSKEKKVYTQSIKLDGDFVEIATTDFEFANQFQRDCLQITDKGFVVRANCKGRIHCE